MEMVVSHFGLVMPPLGGLPNQLGSGSEMNNLDAGMCTRVVIVGMTKGGFDDFHTHAIIPISMKDEIAR